MGCTGSANASQAVPKKVNKMIWFYGITTAGKSWCADFGAKYHDWIHIDGDEVLMRTDPAKSKLWLNKLIEMEQYQSQDKEAPEEFFGPYLMDRIEATKKARAENPDKTIAVAFAMYTQAHRDFVRKHSPEPVSFVEVAVKDKAEVAARRMPRMKAFCESKGMTEAEGWASLGFDKTHGPFEGPVSWEKLFCGKDPFAGFRTALGKDDQDVFFVDSGHLSAGTVPGLEKALGLPHIENPDIQAVCQMNNDRAAESMKQKELIETAYKQDLEKRLQSSAFLGGEAPSDEDFHTLRLLTEAFDQGGKMRYKAVTEEDYPTLFKYIALMAEQKKD